MSFFEPLQAAQQRSHARWDKGVSDFRSLNVAGKALAAGTGAGSAVAGASFGVLKTVGVAGYEFYSQSFGEKRGRTVFDYLTTAPILQTLVMGGFAAGAGAALHHFGVHLRWNIIPTTFLAGTVTYLGAQFTRYLADVVGVSAHGFAGASKSWVKHRLAHQSSSDVAAPAPRETAVVTSSVGPRPPRSAPVYLVRPTGQAHGIDARSR